MTNHLTTPMGSADDGSATPRSKLLVRGAASLETVIGIGWSQTRRRAAGWFVVVLLVAIGGGATLAAAAAGRRTASVITRFGRTADTADLVVDYDGPVSLVGIPGVLATSQSIGLGAFWIHDGRADLAGIDQVIASIDGRYLTSERPALSAGRLPDPRKINEAFIDVNTARAAGLAVGDRVELGVVPAGAPIDDLALAVRHARRTTVTIVGVGVMTDEVVQDDIARSHRMVLTPAFYRALKKPTTTFTQTALHLAPGTSLGVAQRTVAARVSRAVARGEVQQAVDLSFADQREIAARAERATRPTALGFGLFAATTALVTILVVGEAMARIVRQDAEDLPTLGALGLTSRQMAMASSVGPVLAAVSGMTASIVVAWLLSPLAPVGPGRRVEPHPGFHLDVTALGGGAVVLLCFMLARVATLVAATLRSSGRSARTSPEKHLLKRGDRYLGPVVAVGVGLALRPGAQRGSSRRPALLGIAASLAFFILVMTFGAGLSRLVHDPSRYGWNWDVALNLGSGYGRLDDGGTASTGTITRQTIERVPGIRAASSTRFEELNVDGSAVPAIGVRPFLGHVDLAMSSGHPPRTSGEASLGASTARRLHLAAGDQVTVSAGSRRRRLLVTGIAVFPGLGRVDTQRTGLGTGIELTGAGLDRLVPCRTYEGAPCTPGGGDNALIIDYGAHVDHGAATAALRRRYGDPAAFIRIIGPQRSADVVDDQELVRIARVLAIVLGLAAVAGFLSTVSATAREHRSDFAILKAIGFTPRQVASAIAWEAVTIGLAAGVVGIPLGVAAGRQLWAAFARQAGIQPDPVTSYLLIAATITLAPVLAVLLALPTAGKAARMNPSRALRSA